MATHSRHHHRSLFSRIRKWMGFSDRRRKSHHRHGTIDPNILLENTVNEKSSLIDKSSVHNELQGNQISEGIRRYRHRKKHSWNYRFRRRLSRLFSPGRNKSAQSPLKSLQSRLKRLLRLGRKPEFKPELFYKRDKDGSYKVIRANPVTSSGINEDETSSQKKFIEPNPHRRQKTIPAWKRQLRKLSRILTGNNSDRRRHTRRRSHSSHLHGAKPELIFESPLVPDSGHSHHSHHSHQSHTSHQSHHYQHSHHPHGVNHKHFSFREMVRSWMSLSFMVKLFSSMGLFITAYIVTWMTYSLASMVIASFSEVYGVMYYFEVLWPDATSAMPGAANDSYIAAAGPVISLVMCLVYFIILKWVKNIHTQLKTFLYWLFLLSAAHFLNMFIAGVMPWRGVTYGIALLHLPVVVKPLFAGIAILTLVSIGWKFARFILEIRPIRRHGNNIPLILINRMALPWLIATLLLAAIKIPNSVPQHAFIWKYDVIMLASLLFAVIPPLFNKKLRPVQQASKTVLSETRKSRAFLAIFLSIAVVLLFRIGLSSGLYVYMKFAIHISSY